MYDSGIPSFDALPIKPVGNGRFILKNIEIDETRRVGYEYYEFLMSADIWIKTNDGDFPVGTLGASADIVVGPDMRPLFHEIIREWKIDRLTITAFDKIDIPLDHVFDALNATLHDSGPFGDDADTVIEEGVEALRDLNMDLIDRRQSLIEKAERMEERDDARFEDVIEEANALRDEVKGLSDDHPIENDIHDAFIERYFEKL